MKKLNLKFNDITPLSKEQMKKIGGGDTCSVVVCGVGDPDLGLYCAQLVENCYFDLMAYCESFCGGGHIDYVGCGSGEC